MMTPLFSYAATAHPPAMIASYQERYQIYSTSNLDCIEKELETLDSDSLVLFDVDSTLIIPDDAVLRPSNEGFLLELLGGNFAQNLPTGLRYIFREILLNAPHSLVDVKSISCIQSLQARGVPVMAFTAAPRGKVGEIASVADWRIEELKKFGFDFTSTFSDKGNIELPKRTDKEFSPIFKSGILFSSLHPKGETLQQFFYAIGWTPKRVVFIDDQLKEIQSVGQALESLGIPYTGFHYTAAEKLPQNLNREIAQFQVRSFMEQGKWIDDVQAKEQLHLKPVIYFDFGGVMAEPDKQIQLDYLVEILGFPAEALSDSPYFRWMQLHPKEIYYLKYKGAEHRISLTDDDLVRYSEVKRSAVRAVPGMQELVSTLRQMNYEVNLVTNIRSENYDLVEPFKFLFNKVIHCPKDSGERRETWEMEWLSHKMTPDQCLLIDDQEPNVREADRLGMQSIQFENVDALTEQLIEQNIFIPQQK